MSPTRTGERTQRERSEATTRALVSAARARFSRDGFAATSLDDIASDAGVSKGALYHHFEGGKTDLFRAVFEDEERRIATKTTAAFLQESDPWNGLFAGCKAFFEEIFDTDTQRIALTEGPVVLGADAVREIQERFALAQLKKALGDAIEAGIIARRAVNPLAHMLFGAICEAAAMTARAPDPRATGRQALSELRTLLDSMRIDR